LALVVFMVVYFARPEEWLPGVGSLPLAKLAVIPLLLALFLSIDKLQWRWPMEISFFIALTAQLWAASVFSPVWKGGAVTKMLEFSKILPLVLAMYWTVRSMRRLQWLLFVQAASVVAIAVVSVAHAHILGGRLVGAIGGMYGNSNDLAAAIDISLPLCLVFAITARRYIVKAAWICAMPVMIYAVFLTASRAGVIALGVMVLVCLFRLGIKGRYSYILLPIPIAMIIVWVYAGNSLRQRFEDTSNDGGAYMSAEESAQQRKELLIKSLEVTLEHPLFGVGPGNFEVVSGVWHVAHNSNTQMSAEGGIPAFVLYALILWRGIANVQSVMRSKATDTRIRLFAISLEASLAAYLVGSFFASVQYLLLPYCLIAYTTALHMIAKRQSGQIRRAELEEANKTRSRDYHVLEDARLLF
jgi:O-antigen ligase